MVLSASIGTDCFLVGSGFTGEHHRNHVTNTIKDYRNGLSRMCRVLLIVGTVFVACCLVGRPVLQGTRSDRGQNVST